MFITIFYKCSQLIEYTTLVTAFYFINWILLTEMRCQIVTEHLIILNLLDIIIPDNLELDNDITSHFVIHKYVKNSIQIVLYLLLKVHNLLNNSLYM